MSSQILLLFWVKPSHNHHSRGILSSFSRLFLPVKIPIFLYILTAFFYLCKRVYYSLDKFKLRKFNRRKLSFSSVFNHRITECINQVQKKKKNAASLFIRSSLLNLSLRPRQALPRFLMWYQHWLSASVGFFLKDLSKEIPWCPKRKRPIKSRSFSKCYDYS